MASINGAEKKTAACHPIFFSTPLLLDLVSRD
jgi:hypothetical protein